MGDVRPLLARDIPEVARLWLKVFRQIETPAPRSLSDYFAEVFFGNPWRDPELPSLVYDGHGGAIAGFLGVLPRKMEYEGRSVRVAVTTQFMVDPASRRSLAALHLLRDFFAGPQELSLTDGANDASQKLWVGLGGSVALLQSLEWSRVLRPTRHMAGLLSRKRWGRFARATGPFCGAMDGAVAHLPFGPYRLAKPRLIAEEATVQTLSACLGDGAIRAALRPTYDPDSLAWLLGLAARNQKHGTLQKVVLRDDRGRVGGWYLYYLKPGGASQVVQFGARDGVARPVLDSLFHHAARRGSVSVNGQLEPRYVRELSDSHCVFRCLSLGVLVHSRNSELLAAIQRGDAFLSRLEGEWCLRFGPDRLN